MSRPPGGHVDKRWVRRGFGRSAEQYDSANFLAREIGTRMQERLDLLRAVPERILDLGSGTGWSARLLRQRYPRAELIEIDLALEMLVRSRGSWWERGWQRLKREDARRVCGDMECLPFRDRTFSMAWSNLALHWASPAAVLAEVHRVLRPGGVFMFSTLGPDTLKELRDSFSQADDHVHVNRFVDLHDIGDALVSGRFADPVMDMEYLTFTYDSLDALLRELRAGGARNANVDRPQGLTGRRSYERMRAAYEAHRRDGRLPATFEIIYGHAWRPDVDQRLPSGEAVVQFHPRSGSSR